MKLYLTLFSLCVSVSSAWAQSLPGDGAELGTTPPATALTPLLVSGAATDEQLMKAAIHSCETEPSKDGLPPGKPRMDETRRTVHFQGLPFTTKKVFHARDKVLIRYFNQTVRSLIILCERPLPEQKAPAQP